MPTPSSFNSLSLGPKGKRDSGPAWKRRGGGSLDSPSTSLTPGEGPAAGQTPCSRVGTRRGDLLPPQCIWEHPPAKHGPQRAREEDRHAVHRPPKLSPGLLFQGRRSIGFPLPCGVHGPSSCPRSGAGPRMQQGTRVCQAPSLQGVGAGGDMQAGPWAGSGRYMGSATWGGRPRDSAPSSTA